MKIPFKKSKRGVALKIKVEPRSSRRGISGIAGDTVKIKVHSPPVEGAANKEVIEILSAELDIRKTAIRILTGRKSREKVVEIEGIELQKLMEGNRGLRNKKRV